MPAIPQGNFSKFRDLVTQAMTETSFLPKAAEVLVRDWLLTRADLTVKFVYPLIRAAFQREVQALYQSNGTPRKAARPSPTVEEATAPATEDMADLAPDAGEQSAAFSPDDLEDIVGVTWEDVPEFVNGVLGKMEDGEAHEITEERPLSPQARARQEILWNPAWRAMALAMDEPLLDGTRLGDATRPQLLANARHAGVRQMYYELIANCLPDEDKHVADHLTEEDLHNLWTLAQREAGREREGIA